MKILISNDDGINANGIRVLSKTLSKEHTVYIVAPDRERSAAAHSLTLHTPLRVDELEPKYGSKKTWTTTGTPGDCVKIAINAILDENEKPDIIISGINHGPNLGSDILYSGTVSCAVEGAMMGFKSVAVSLASLRNELHDFKFAAEFVNGLLPKICKINYPKTVLNINVPGLNSEDISGIKITEMGGRVFTDTYEKRVDPRGKTYYWMAGELIHEKADDMTDIAAIRDNKISITPLTYEMTRKGIIENLNKVLCDADACNWY